MTIRGLIIYLLRRFDPSLGVVWLVVISSIIFGFAHAYQGVQGIIASACVGAMFAVLFVTTHSLLIPIILHALIDLRALLIPLPRSTPEKNIDELNTTV
jgi:membrane protease YdiL (CAAX protease family)